MDHMAFDSARGLLYVAAVDNNTLEVVNVTSNRLIGTRGGFSEPQGVLLIPSSHSLYVSNGGSGIVNVLNATTLESIANVSLGSDADNMRYDQASNRVYVGYGTGGIAVINPSSNTLVAEVPLAGHPESFQIDSSTSTLYVNVPTSGYVAVVNLTSQSVVQRWPLANESGNYPMTLGPQGSLFVGTRSPPQLLALDSRTGAQVGGVAIPQDPDDVFYNPVNGCVYVSSGSGFVTMVRQGGSGYAIVGQVTTFVGARTSLLDQQSGLLFVAVPSYGVSTAGILVFRT